MDSDDDRVIEVLAASGCPIAQYLCINWEMMYDCLPSMPTDVRLHQSRISGVYQFVGDRDR